MPCKAIQDRWVIAKSSDKMWSTGGGNGNPLQYSCLENPMDSIKKQKDMVPGDEPLPTPHSQSEGVQYSTRAEQRAVTNSYRKKKWLGESRNDAQL